MLSKLANHIAQRLVANKSVIEDDEPLVAFGIMIGLRSLIQVILLLTTAAIMNQFVLGVVVLLAFTPVRVFAGGYHAKTPIQCLIKSWLLYFCILLWSAFVPQIFLLQFLVLGVAGISVWRFAPVEDEHKPLEDYEIAKYRKKACVFWCVEVFVFIIAYFLECYVLSRGIVLGESMMLIILYLGLCLRSRKDVLVLGKKGTN